MHRVELKAASLDRLAKQRVGVPNAPCGVERSTFCGNAGYRRREFLMHRVELKACSSMNSESALKPFLMHRVELKASIGVLLLEMAWVPNAPCGVERKVLCLNFKARRKPFLMHRVELKVS